MKACNCTLPSVHGLKICDRCHANESKIDSIEVNKARQGTYHDETEINELFKKAGLKGLITSQ